MDAALSDAVDAVVSRAVPYARETVRALARIAADSRHGMDMRAEAALALGGLTERD